HGRGVWVLDDLTAVQQYTPSVNRTLTLFAPRPAFRWAHFAPINAFQDGLPQGDFTGPNVDYGVLLTYALPKPDKHATIDVLDSSGRVIRHLAGKDVPHKAGINRAAWDLNVEGPTKWHDTFEFNQGPNEGPEVVPGTYTIRVNANGTHVEQTAVVTRDPRDPLTAEQMEARYDFMTELFREYSIADRWLNEIDKRVKTRHSTPALLAFKRELTYNPRNVEDLSGPPGFRDRLGDLMGRMSGNYAPPTESQINEANALRAMFDDLQKRQPH
ncbi:MAG TPA: hypothetical protein VIO32_07590, partial [Candidatus Baltobacteraceae bacterium]